MIRLGTNSISQSDLDDYFDFLTNGKNGFLSPKNKLANWISSGTLGGERLDLVSKLHDEFEAIIKAKPNELRKFIEDYGIINENFSKEIIEHLRYDNFRKSARAVWLTRKLELKACPYCNAQFTITLGKSGKVLCHFDHVYPKSLYPYLCMSFYNLIPSCSSCNQMKSNVDPIADVTFIHPYEDSLANHFTFEATANAISRFHLNGRTTSGENNVNIKINAGIDLNFHIKKFYLKELYNEHNDIVDEAYLKALIYNTSYYEELKNKYVPDLMSEEELDRIIYGTYMDDAEINKRPLSKLIQDLHKQFLRLKLSG